MQSRNDKIIAEYIAMTTELNKRRICGSQFWRFSCFGLNDKSNIQMYSITTERKEYLHPDTIKQLTKICKEYNAVFSINSQDEIKGFKIEITINTNSP